MSESEFNDYNEVIYERDKLKEQNEKLKEACKRAAGLMERDKVGGYSRNHTGVPYIEKGSTYEIVSETLKSCES